MRSPMRISGVIPSKGMGVHVPAQALICSRDFWASEVIRETPAALSKAVGETTGARRMRGVSISVSLRTTKPPVPGGKYDKEK